MLDANLKAVIRPLDPMSTPTYDAMVFGATSFVGQILCRYLWEEFGLQGEMKRGRGRALAREIGEATEFARERRRGAAARRRRRF